ncbi:MAG: hydrogenase maturation protein [Bacteroidetes bacterium]|nr:MAG: hydrogenase maturation protein [Bacteroidota bacterium]
MKILFLTSAFNGMAQRAWIELDRLNHQVKVQIATEAAAMEKAVEDFEPELIIAPFLKQKIPSSIWQKHCCLVIHPGIKGDRGASSLDWAILNGEPAWGVTILQAVEKMDAGPIWAFSPFAMPFKSKACLYRHEVTQAAMRALLQAVERFQTPGFQPQPLDPSHPEIRGRWRRRTRQSDFAFEWSDPAVDIWRKIHAADSDPGVLVEIGGAEYYAFGAHLEEQLKGKPGEILAQRNKAICMGTGENSIWLTHLKQNQAGAIKLPATLALGKKAQAIPEAKLTPFEKTVHATFREIWYEEEGAVGYVHFNFYNGAMDTAQCLRLKETIAIAKTRPVKVLVLMGGQDLWSNGIHLNVIEHAENPADESWANIHAINDLILEIITSPNHYLITALQGNAGAGGVSLALAGDKVLAREGIVLNPHTRNMGLYGSEYWTYLLPKRIGIKKARQFTEQCLPWGTAVAKEIGLIDHVFGDTAEAFREGVKEMAQEVVRLPYFEKLLMAKRFQRQKDERVKPLASYREEELARMWANFYENDQGYHEKRFRFVHKLNEPAQSQQVEGRDWYRSRREIYRRRKWEPIDYQ